MFVATASVPKKIQEVALDLRTSRVKEAAIVRNERLLYKLESRSPVEQVISFQILADHPSYALNNHYQQPTEQSELPASQEETTHGQLGNLTTHFLIETDGFSDEQVLATFNAVETLSFAFEALCTSILDLETTKVWRRFLKGKPLKQSEVTQMMRNLVKNQWCAAHNGTITMTAVKAMSKQQLIEEYENICRRLEKDRLLSAQYNLFRPKPAITEPPSKRQRVERASSQPSNVPAATTQPADDHDSAGGSSVFHPAFFFTPPLSGSAAPTSDWRCRFGVFPIQRPTSAARISAVPQPSKVLRFKPFLTLSAASPPWSLRKHQLANRRRRYFRLTPRRRCWTLDLWKDVNLFMDSVRSNSDDVKIILAHSKMTGLSNPIRVQLLELILRQQAHSTTLILVGMLFVSLE
ncbi:hypothetical protein Tco_0199078 [Tanacetum coccineum]